MLSSARSWFDKLTTRHSLLRLGLAARTLQSLCAHTMHHDPSPSLITLRAQLAGHAFDLAAIRLQLVLKANFNPGQLRLPAGQTGGGRWTSDGGGSVQRVADRPPPLRRIHPDTTYERDPKAKRSYEFWSQQPTDRIVESLRPGEDEPLVVMPDGRISQGNTRTRVLEERGYDVNSLPRTPHPDLKTGPRRSGGRGGGGGGPPPRFFKPKM